MTAAFAKELGLYARYQSVIVDETWSRSGDIYLSVGHVNLTLGRRQIDGGFGHAETDLMTIDFLPPQDIRHQRVRVIGEETIVAMYMNNRAVEALSAGDVDNAYWWARESIRQDPKFLSAYNTLGVIYHRHGNRASRPSACCATCSTSSRPTSTRCRTSSRCSRTSGRIGRERGARRRLAAIEPDPPFKFYNLGLAALEQGDYRAARDLFAKEVERAAYYHEFHFWLAIAHLGLGETRQARKHMALARGEQHDARRPRPLRREARPDQDLPP